MTTAAASGPVRLDTRGRWVLIGWALVMLANVVNVAVRPLGWSLDLRVYRAGGEAWLHGFPVYVDGFAVPIGGPDLPFTYPPIAVLVFALVALVPLPVAIVGIAVVNVLSLSAVCLVAAVRVHGRNQRALLWGLGSAAVVSVFDPIRETLWFGQINLILAVLVIVDCLLPRRFVPRGALIGLAAAIKLTPAAFALFFVARREWRPVLTAIGSFLVFGVIGFLVMPSDAQRFWLHALLDPGRVGRLTYASNQSMRGTLARLGLPDGAQVVTWVLLGLVVVGLAWFVAARFSRAGDDLTAFLAVAVAGLLISPVSWGHHWVWIGPGLVLLGAARRTDLRYRVVAALVVAVFAVGPHWLFPRDNDVERDWAWWQQVVGNAYVWCGVAVLVGWAWIAWRGIRGTPGVEPGLGD
ncbi:glycosyltransferase 87 family protein [Actinosynnema sp. NPDC047251]|uniref:Glycosyltransferase-like protein n=1 Tax=Saccharothrix espanaensis (strain ATCC 51144 / DSM 44229 / JCM 9112 / NBRC 15066 / NRRL 15764) TaxID=1179773 RepID=K0KAQ2_SACES|nr:glycosyltransferase 87 family protein [Saccharothrix espanaensis]CCH33904.1 Glycosyltransferase-like protein [Saccharothrix espanaensis DSM 44229]